MATLYRIKDWGTCYENNRTRDLKQMLWVPIPTRLDGDGYTELLDHKNGAAHYGVWVGCVIVAARCDPRGTLLRGTKKPFCACSLSRVLRMPESLIEDALKRFISIGWMESELYAEEGVATDPQEGAVIPQESAAKSQDVASLGREGMEGRNGREWKEGTAGSCLPSELDTHAFRLAWKDWLTYRTKKRKPVTELAMGEQLADLARYGPDVAVEAIRASIRSDWQGLFPEKIKNASRPTYGAGQRYINGSELGPV